MKDRNEHLYMSFGLQHKLCLDVIHMPLKSLESIARALSPNDYKKLRYYHYKKGTQSTCVYKTFLALIIYDNHFMQAIFKEEEI